MLVILIVIIEYGNNLNEVETKQEYKLGMNLQEKDE
jgi:hypothetical protein